MYLNVLLKHVKINVSFCRIPCSSYPACPQHINHFHVRLNLLESSKHCWTFNCSFWLELKCNQRNGSKFDPLLVFSVKLINTVGTVLLYQCFFQFTKASLKFLEDGPKLEKAERLDSQVKRDLLITCFLKYFSKLVFFVVFRMVRCSFQQTTTSRALN